MLNRAFVVMVLLGFPAWAGVSHLECYVALSSIEETSEPDFSGAFVVKNNLPAGAPLEAQGREVRDFLLKLWKDWNRRVAGPFSFNEVVLLPRHASETGWRVLSLKGDTLYIALPHIPFLGFSVVSAQSLRKRWDKGEALDPAEKFLRGYWKYLNPVGTYFLELRKTLRAQGETVSGILKKFESRENGFLGEMLAALTAALVDPRVLENVRARDESAVRAALPAWRQLLESDHFVNGIVGKIQTSLWTQLGQTPEVCVESEGIVIGNFHWIPVSVRLGEGAEALVEVKMPKVHARGRLACLFFVDYVPVSVELKSSLPLMALQAVLPGKKTSD